MSPAITCSKEKETGTAVISIAEFLLSIANVTCTQRLQEKCQEYRNVENFYGPERGSQHGQ